MGSGTLVVLMDNAEFCGVNQHDGQGSERHREWEEGARLPGQGEKGLGMRMRFEPWSWEDALMNC
jgi:hypothetical protein